MDEVADQDDRCDVRMVGLCRIYGTTTVRDAVMGLGQLDRSLQYVRTLCSFDMILCKLVIRCRISFDEIFYFRIGGSDGNYLSNRTLIYFKTDIMQDARKCHAFYVTFRTRRYTYLLTVCYASLSDNMLRFSLYRYEYVWIEMFYISAIYVGRSAMTWTNEPRSGVCGILHISCYCTQKGKRTYTHNSISIFIRLCYNPNPVNPHLPRTSRAHRCAYHRATYETSMTASRLQTHRMLY